MKDTAIKRTLDNLDTSHLLCICFSNFSTENHFTKYAVQFSFALFPSSQFSQFLQFGLGDRKK